METSGSLTLLLAGLAAGLGVALPLGAIGVLILSEGLTHGRRPALAAAGGVAVVDTVYCLVAVSVGTSVAPALRAAGAWPALASGVIVIALGLRQWRTSAPTPGAQATPPPAPGHVFWRFVALTMVNPVTVIYFLALAAGLRLSSITDAVAFVTGAGLASLAWQTLLAVAGSSLGHALSPRVAAVLNRTAAIIVVTLGASLATQALIR